MNGARAAVSLFRCGGALPVFGGGCDRGADAGHKGYFAEWIQRPGRRLEVLQNWLGAPADAPSTIVVGETALASVNAGNDLVGLIEQECVGRSRPRRR